ncbi:hypothetical protein D3C83_89180 [compost metagenome]
MIVRTTTAGVTRIEIFIDVPFRVVVRVRLAFDRGNRVDSSRLGEPVGSAVQSQKGPRKIGRRIALQEAALLVGERFHQQ